MTVCEATNTLIVHLIQYRKLLAHLKPTQKSLVSGQDSSELVHHYHLKMLKNNCFRHYRIFQKSSMDQTI